MRYSHDVIVIGAGAGGLTAAGGCAMLGLKVALVERGEMGGDCLNSGCVPSKALIAAAHRAHEFRHSAHLGIADAQPRVDYGAVHAHIHGAIATIAPVDSQERFEEMGCEVLRGEARFLGPKRMAVKLADGEREISAPRIVLAVGGKPFVPPVEGIDQIPYLTNESLWALTELPEHLIVLGGGPIGMEMAQSFRRLGSVVTVVTKGRPFPKDDSDAATIAIERLKAEGMDIITNAEAKAVSAESEGICLTLDNGDTVSGSHLLVATGRTTDFSALDLEKAGVRHNRHGIIVDRRRRTSARHIYAIGDCRPGPHFTHASGYEGGNVVMEIGFGIPAKADYRALPWVTYVDPELGQVGMTEAAARKKHGGRVSVWREDFSHNDRAIAEGDTAGFVKIVRVGSKVVGGTVVGRHAGDLLLPIAMMIKGAAKPFALASLILPYPNRSEHLKAAAFASEEHKVFNRWTRRWAKLLAKLRW
ncbi:MAG: FAD-dependent oxidoreductase [Blastomonas sp.]